MSQERALGITLIEKIIGIALMIIGSFLAYNTYKNSNIAGNAAFFFIAAGLMLIVLGFIILIAKTK